MTHRQPLVTVIIASYNHGPYIEASIGSVLRQTYPEIELLVIDDGSTDDSVERIERLRQLHPFDFRRQENQGLTRTLNAALERSRGEFIAPFGSDDIMLPHRIQRQVEYMLDKPEVGICAGNIEKIDADGRPLPDRKQSRELPFRRLNFEDIFLDRKPYPPAPTLLFRRQALAEIGGFDTNIQLEDLLAELKICQAGYYVDALGEVLAQYRKHGSNSFRNMRFMIDSILYTYDQFREHPGYDQARYRFLNSMFLKSSERDKGLARELLAQIPVRQWNRKTLRGLGRLYLLPVRRS